MVFSLFSQSSDIRKIVPIRWNKIKFDYDIEEMYRHGPKPSKELSQWISPLYIKRSSNGRMVIDWLGNIHVKSLEKFDLNFIYRFVFVFKDYYFFRWIDYSRFHM